MEIDYEGFSIREYTKNVRSVEVRKCWPFSGYITGDLIQSLLPPITVVKFRWWSHELASLLAKSPVAADDSDPVFRRKATTTKSKSKPCKKRSIVEIFAASPQIQSSHREVDDGNDSDVLVSSKRKRMRNLVVQKKIKSKKSKDSDDRKSANKVNNSKRKEQARQEVDDGNCSIGFEESSVGVMSLNRKKVGSFSREQNSEYQIPGVLRVNRKVCAMKTHARFSADQSEKLSQLKINIASLELLCLEMNRLSLFSANEKKTKVMSNEQTNADMQFQPAVSERQLSNAPRGNSGLSCVHGPNRSSQGHVAQPNTSYSSMHCETSLYQSPFDPLLMKWMQKSVLNRQSHVEETISGFPINLQGEPVEAYGEESCRSFDRSGLGTCWSSRFASAENVVDFSSGYKHSTKPTTLAKDVVVGKFEKRHNYFPARLGIDETFTENNDDGEFSHQTLHSPVPSLNSRSHTINLSNQDGLNQNLDIRNNMFANSDGLCLDKNQATMRLMGKDVSIATQYASTDCSFLGSYTHSTSTLDKKWNRSLLQDISKDLFLRFCEPHHVVVVPDLEFPPIVLNPCCSLESFPPTDDKDLTFFHGPGLAKQQPNTNSFTFSQQQHQLPYNNVDIGHLHVAGKGSPFSCTDSTIRSHASWPLINHPAQQLLSRENN